MSLLQAHSVVERAARIKLLLMDVDGVWTDGTIYFVPGAGHELIETKGFNSQDGLGLYFCHEAGLQTGLISGRISPAVEERARILKVNYVYQGHLAKEEAFENILRDAMVSEEETAFMGDDFTDCPLMARAGLAVAVSNARPEVKSIAHLVTACRGGAGAIREVVEIILKSQQRWAEVLCRYKLNLIGEL